MLPNTIAIQLDIPIYITRVKNSQIFCLECKCRTRVLNIDMIVYEFKLALMKYNEVLHMVPRWTEYHRVSAADNSCQEVSLHFFKDEKTRVRLALEGSNIEAALEAAKALVEKQS